MRKEHKRQISFLDFIFKISHLSNFFTFCTKKRINTSHAPLVNFSQSLLCCCHFAIFLSRKRRENLLKVQHLKSWMQIKQDCVPKFIKASKHLLLMGFIRE